MTPSKQEQDVEIAIRALDLNQQQANNLAQFYDYAGKQAWKGHLRLAGAIIRWSLVVVGFGVLLYVFALLWLAL
jgi:hypothetical protein